MYTHNKIHSLKQNKIDKLDFIKVKTIAFQKLPLKKKKEKRKATLQLNVYNKYI